MTFKADLKARMQCHRLEHYYRCKQCCDRCLAIQPMDSRPHPMTYKNTARNAPYASTCKDHDEYLRSARHPSPWCAVPGFQFETMSFDMMHLVYLGIAKNHIPSCLKILKLFGYHYTAGESDEMFLKRVSIEMKQDCKEQKSLVAIERMFSSTLPPNMFDPQNLERDCMNQHWFTCQVLSSGKGSHESTRIYLPRRVLSVTNCGSFGSDDYCELGSRFKAAHIRVMVWWVACKVQQLTKTSES